MKKLFKALLVVGGAALAANFGLKAYKKINGTVKLSKSLPEFLNNVYGEMPEMNINRTLNSLNIRIGFSQEILDKHTDIENTVQEYIDDFYPELCKNSIEINVSLKGEEMEEDADESEVAEDTEEKD
ncbi:MAG: hypothetical protein CVU50_04560 [Candidatus Cloacimonetes bacterium HGW-Cloacimonetes-3]|jgi:hypothetical protein|nr:MAG: hypothetical protein CVU50_04560 [Candidatus Cloacimonetes bacterium HGW-Cloacimonetes-3]